MADANIPVMRTFWPEFDEIWVQSVLYPIIGDFYRSLQ